MNAPRMPDGPPIRNGMPYSRIAHLAEDVRPFVAVGRALEEIGIAAPHIRAQDMHRGLLLLEDLGDLTLGRAIDNGFSQRDLWSAAVDALVSVRRAGLPKTLPLSPAEMHILPAYDRDALGIETELLVDWYWPMLKGGSPSAEARNEFVDLWGAQFERLLTSPMGWVLRDYHSPNLMWRPGREGLARIGDPRFPGCTAGTVGLRFGVPAAGRASRCSTNSRSRAVRPILRPRCRNRARFRPHQLRRCLCRTWRTAQHEDPGHLCPPRAAGRQDYLPASYSAHLVLSRAKSGAAFAGAAARLVRPPFSTACSHCCAVGMIACRLAGGSTQHELATRNGHGARCRTRTAHAPAQQRVAEAARAPEGEAVDRPRA